MFHHMSDIVFQICPEKSEIHVINSESSQKCSFNLPARISGWPVLNAERISAN